MAETIEQSHENLKARVFALSDRVGKVELNMAGVEARVQSAQESIERLHATSATAEQVTSNNTIVNLKLDHLLEKHVDLKTSVSRWTKWTFFCVVCGVVALLYVVWAFAK